ncbi:acetoacetate decarboxylase family protein [Streptomyces mangrovisoli]|uniref:Acetoacetate decarboxylase n=1 Tax=Streptomyces mangrovisoli TaxID=1428628 RepID=A0A1J4NVE2_9ACTN|nr:acetoacetate decarboxylase family protein [Streptomyces mangrovisoli]OIJ65484.1 hypothetical protein WN71_023345 [Streptomyces mangrovisoli]
MTYHPTLAAAAPTVRRMPTAFGPAYGPRCIPAGVEPPTGPERVSSIDIVAAADERKLRALLPDGVELAEATLRVQAGWFENLRWLAGRGYNTLAALVPAVVPTEDGPVRADFLCVMWENLADPIITGRDELGFPKLFADIVRPDVAAPGSEPLSVRASWQETEFFSLTVDGLREAPAPGVRHPVVTHRYLPSAGHAEPPEVDHLTISNPGSADSVRILTSLAGEATVSFTEVTWQQVPFQFPVVNGLAALGINGTHPAQVTCVEGHFTAASNRRLG